MKIILVLLLASFSNFCIAQTDTIYFNKDWGKCARDTAYYYRLIGPQTDSGYQVTDRYKSTNKVQMLGYSLQKDSDVSNGHCIFYNENGTISTDGNFSEGKRNGHFVYYKETGNVDEEGDYKSEMRSGYWTHYFQDTDAIWYTCSYNEGKLDKELLSYYKSGKLKRKAHYNEGKLLSGKCFAEDASEIPFTPFQILPAFDGDYDQFLARHLKYPEKARRHNIHGEVIVNFTVDIDGSIGDFAVLKSVEESIDNEALRVAKKMPKWKPGIIDDKPTKTRFAILINFYPQ